jgi:hypothetical protein
LSGISRSAAYAPGVFLGDKLLAWLVLALGAAMAFGNGLALVRPPKRTNKGDLQRAPVGRTSLMIVVGALAAVWGLASIVKP